MNVTDTIKRKYKGQGSFKPKEGEVKRRRGRPKKVKKKTGFAKTGSASAAAAARKKHELRRTTGINATGTGENEIESASPPPLPATDDTSRTSVINEDVRRSARDGAPGSIFEDEERRMASINAAGANKIDFASPPPLPATDDTSPTSVINEGVRRSARAGAPRSMFEDEKFEPYYPNRSNVRSSYAGRDQKKLKI